MFSCLQPQANITAYRTGEVALLPYFSQVNNLHNAITSVDFFKWDLFLTYMYVFWYRTAIFLWYRSTASTASVVVVVPL